MANLEAYLEAERRGILPENKKAILIEARRRGLVKSSVATHDEDQSFFDLPSNTQSDLIKESFKQTIGAPAIALGKGFIEGATLGAKKYERPLKGSVFEHPYEGAARGTGKFIGTALPLAAAEATGGVGLGLAAGARGAGAFGQGMARALGTGLTLGAAEGAAQNEGVTGSISRAVSEGATFAGIGAVGKSLGYVRKLLGEDLVDSLSNYFFRQKPTVAQRFIDKGEESLGMQAMKFKGRFKDFPLRGFKSRKEVLGKAQEELNLLRNESGAIIDDLNKKALTPNRPQVSISGTPQLAYNPSPIQEVRPSLGVSQPIRPPTTVSESVPNRVIPFTGSRTEPIFGKLGEPVRTEFIADRLQPQISMGGFTSEKEIGSRVGEHSKRDVFGVPVREEIESSVASQKGKFSEIVRSLRDPERYPFTGMKQGPNVNIVDVASDLDPIIKRMGRAGKETGPSSTIERIKQDFINSNPEVTNIGDAVQIKTTLDHIVNDAYNKELIDNSTRDKVYKVLANGLRKRIYKVSPELGENFDKQALLHDVVDSMKLNLRQTGTLPLGGFWRAIAYGVYGNRGGLGLATALKKGFDAPSKIVAPVTRNAARIGISNYDEDR